MTTVVRRTFNSTPRRDALATWHAIVDLLTRGNHGASRTELLSVEGIAASLIADQAPHKAAIVATCEGPRTRIYCLYDDDAIDGGDANEETPRLRPAQGRLAGFATVRRRRSRLGEGRACEKDEPRSRPRSRGGSYAL